ncbi:glycosyl transferase family protein [Erythrobacter sp. HA6-11]
MTLAGWEWWQWFAVLQHELLLFAGIFFLIGALDDFAVDVIYIWRRLTGRSRTPRVEGEILADEELSGPAAIFIPAWREDSVIGGTISHALNVWRQKNITLYVGCYPNDPATMAAVMNAASSDARLRLVIHDRNGPTTKADCLNRLYKALEADERRAGKRVRMVLFHDAEDLVDPAGLALLNRAILSAEFAQLPVLPMPRADSRWIGSHYCEEFAEAHAKAMVVRSELGAALPAAGVGCAVSRLALLNLADSRSGVPFAADSLTEDYELGIAVAAQGGKSTFVRARAEDGSLIATRSYFPGRLDHVVRQKTRWIHGIALQGWDRLGWSRSPLEFWMRMRDRRGPLTALVLLIGYALLALATLGWGASSLGLMPAMQLTPALEVLLLINFGFFAWRTALRFAFTTREYGVIEGLRAVLRIPVANIIAIMAGRRAVMAYLGTLAGSRIEWDKTDHAAQPNMALTRRLMGRHPREAQAEAEYPA